MPAMPLADLRDGALEPGARRHSPAIHGHRSPAGRPNLPVFRHDTAAIPTSGKGPGPFRIDFRADAAGGVSRRAAGGAVPNEPVLHIAQPGQDLHLDSARHAADAAVAGGLLRAILSFRGVAVELSAISCSHHRLWPQLLGIFFRDLPRRNRVDFGRTPSPRPSSRSSSRR